MTSRRTALTFGCLALCLLAGGAHAADIALPTGDVPGSKDSSFVGRFSESAIVDYLRVDYDALILPLSALTPVPGKKDAHNNTFHEPKAKKELEGARTRIVYLLPQGATPLQAMRNYQNEVKAQGGRTLFECKDTDCGGSMNLSVGGGGRMSLSMHLWPHEKVTVSRKSPAHCALRQDITEQRYTSLEWPGSRAYASVLAYSLKGDSSECKAFANRTVVALDVLEPQGMAQKMLAPKADEMARAIDTTGRVALYGIYFDSNKAELKPQSKETLEQIAQLLKTQPPLKLIVVGHTDNVGGFAANIDLSKRRAEAVVSALVSQYKVDPKRLTALGVSFASPIAPNSSEEGRAKNRRVELVSAS
jgi:OmpA-OmpF porin, OOP family